MTSPTHRYDMPFGLPDRGGPTSSVWREQVIAEVDQTRFAVERYLDGEHARRIEATLQSACAAAEDRDLRWFGRLRSAFYGASAERAWGAIDAANEALLRDAPPEYVVGQFPRIKRRVQGALDRDDVQRHAL